MQNPFAWYDLTHADLERLRLELDADNPKIELARTFLTISSGSEKADLNPAILKEFGETLSDPDAMIQGPGVLVWQNLMRRKGTL